MLTKYKHHHRRNGHRKDIGRSPDLLRESPVYRERCALCTMYATTWVKDAIL